jgi:hypothetical protein
MPHSWDKFLPHVIVLRVRRSTKNGGTQSNSTVNHHEGDGSIPPGITSAFPLLIPVLNLLLANAVSASTETSSEATTTEPYWRRASDMAQLILPVVQETARAIPVAGAPMTAAIGGLLLVLQNIDVSTESFVDSNDFVDFKGYHREKYRIREI